MKKSVHSKEYAILLRLLKQARERAELTQEQLADMLGVNQTFVSKSERGERRVDVIELRLICAALGINFLQFVESLENLIRQRNRQST